MVMNRLEQRASAIDCPVLGRRVKVSATFRAIDHSRELVDFSCSMTGKCGIPAWDPCPLYIGCLEKQSWLRSVWED